MTNKGVFFARASIVALAGGLAGGPAPAAGSVALPKGGAYVAGSGAITASGKSLTIDQTSKRGIIDWKSFSIGKGGSVTFDNKGGATLNRVTGGDLTTILGTLKASGTVYLINPQGVVIGKSGVVVTGGSFTASTLDVANSAFLAGGTLLFKGTTDATVKNLGSISSTGGDVFLIARSVENDGTISAATGTVGLAAGSQVLIKDAGSDERVFVQVGTGNVTNAGTIAAASAELKAAGGNVYALAGSNGGIVRATGTATRDGHVWLTASSGTVSVAGTVAAANADGTGGTITAKAETLKIAAKAVIDAAGTKGHGTIETSGHDVSIHSARITAGKGGDWLVDPDRLIIDAALAATIDTALDAGTNVTEQTTASGTGGNGDILVNSSIAWDTSASLTLSAYRNIAIGSGISISNSYSTSGGSIPRLTLRADNSGIGTGTVSFGARGKVDFSQSIGSVSLYYNPQDGASQSTVNAQRYTTSVGYAGGSAGYKAQVAVGSGGAFFPYMLVNTLFDLQNIENAVGGVYALSNDINASATAGWNGGAGFLPINNFVGTLNGLSHVVDRLHINRPKDGPVGLFGSTGNATSAVASILNIGLTNVSIKGYGSVGGLVGDNQSGIIQNSFTTGIITRAGKPSSSFGGLVGANGTGSTSQTASITNSYSTVVISSSSGLVDDVGGLVGYNAGLISGSHSRATGVSGSTYVGGLVGQNSGTINTSYSTGTVSGSTDVGGLVGNNSGVISSSYAKGKVYGVSAVGGLVGYNYGKNVQDSDSTGSVSGYDSVGGLVGKNYGMNIEDSYSTGSVSGYSSVGGLVGYDAGGGIIQSSYNVGRVTGNQYVGGLVGYLQYSEILQSYSTGTVSGSSDVGGLTGADYGGEIENSYSTGSSQGMIDVGGLLGFEADARIEQSYSTGAVSGTSYVGGLVGGSANDNAIIESHSSGQVSGSIYVGGLVGYFTGSRISNAGNYYGISLSQSTSIISGSENVGGLVGLSTGKIIQSYATGNVIEGDKSTLLGGLVGYNGGTIVQSYASGSVSGYAFVGGLAGRNTGSITQSYGDGAVTGQSRAGGLVGLNDGMIEASYSLGETSGSIDVGGLVGINYGSVATSYSSGSTTGLTLVGGLVGASQGNVSQSYSTGPVAGVLYYGGLIGSGADVSGSYWDTTTSGQSTSSGGTGLTTAQMANQANYTGWDFTNTWYLIAGMAHPILRSELWGTTIVNAHQLELIGQNATTLAGQYTLGADISMAELGSAAGPWLTAGNASIDGGGYGFVSIGSLATPFTGSLKGQGYTIDGLTIHATGNYVGLFGYLGSGGVLTDLGLTDVSVSGVNYVGGLVGNTTGGTITQAYVTGTVSGAADVGGLVGNSTSGVVGQSFTTGSVSATGNNAGGLVGYNRGGAITQSFSVASVSGASSVGGLLGSNTAGSVDQSYAAGKVTATGKAGGLIGGSSGMVTDSYWDIQATGQTTSAGGTGLTTAQLQSALPAGFDPTIWGAKAGDYPYLLWLYPNGP